MTVRFASISDLPQIKELLTLCEEYNRDTIPKKKDMEYFKNVIECDDSLSSPFAGKKIIVFYNEQGQLQVLFEMFFRDVTPSWAIVGFIVRPGRSYFNCSTNGHKEVLTFCLNYAESRGYYMYEWTQRKGVKYDNTYNRMRSQIPILERYDYYDIGFIPANCKSVFASYFRITGLEVKSYDQLVRCGVLKNEYRENLDLSKKL
jgi:hypothetical protein